MTWICIPPGRAKTRMKQHTWLGVLLGVSRFIQIFDPRLMGSDEYTSSFLQLMGRPVGLRSLFIRQFLLEASKIEQMPKHSD